ncbi:hypothetical protein [Halalkalicoccus jeotgali]|uniref:Uncharacterized protein n=1 Tax=Halalkalicoccus jeotgali (strain DSM 18796 / CECT 7217 / JCM 14584 / KCTC 4019 / B3) TaxID=795797 RepID=D8J528_HALJB|nr:hypothetical protein [Halalkalicoccus jeotgali]ADJ13609.1 hypothetical protein HacjB3_01080 [Halalkalicoccus jeotgali B3]ELY33369.1 hypothetical protein C497_18252 [Halalkalicoccus jeotgali B3]
MNRDGTLYEIVHFGAVVSLAYAALYAASLAGVTEFWAELLIAGVVGVGYVLVAFYLDLAPPSWRGE